MSIIDNPKRRIVEDLKIRNKDNMKVVAGEYFGSKFTYEQPYSHLMHHKMHLLMQLWKALKL